MSEMHIVVITGLCPTSVDPHAVPFIYERLKQLYRKGISYQTYTIANEYSKLIHLVYRIVKGHPLQPAHPVSWSQSEPIHIIVNKINVFRLFQMRISPNKYFQRVIHLLKKEVPITSDTIIHAHWMHPHGYYAVEFAKLVDRPCIVTAHGSDIHTLPKKNPTAKKYIRKTLDEANKVIFVSQGLLESAKELGYTGENAVIIPNGTDSTEFYPMMRETALQRTGWCQSKKNVVGFVGNIIPVKRADKFPEIFTSIQKRVDDVEFILLGDGLLKETLQIECSKRGLLVTFINRVPHDEVVNWMNLFDVMILPSRNEGWPCVVLEAYACGTPVVGSDVGGISEAMGGLGTLVKDGENFEERFAEAVCITLMHADTIDKATLIGYAQEHSWEGVVQQEITLYQNLLRSQTG